MVVQSLLPGLCPAKGPRTVPMEVAMSTEQQARAPTLAAVCPSGWGSLAPDTRCPLSPSVLINSDEIGLVNIWLMLKYIKKWSNL